MGPETLPSALSHRPAPTELALRHPNMLQTALERPVDPEDDDSALTLSDLLGMVLKHKWTLLMVVLVTTTIAGINTFLQRPTYRAPAVLQIARAAARIVEFKSGFVVFVL